MSQNWRSFVPADKTVESAADWKAGWDSHREEEIVRIAQTTTAAERFQWLEEMLVMLRPQMPTLIANRQRSLERHYPPCTLSEAVNTPPTELG